MIKKDWDTYFDAVRSQNWADAKNALRRILAEEYDNTRLFLRLGDSGDSLFLIDSGRAKVVAHLLGREIELAILGEGDVFGEVAFLTGRPRTAGVVAVGLLRVWQIGRLAVEGVIEKNPSVLSVLEDFYEGRVRDTIKKAKPG
jgi:CRP-like cAMP-binding protein